MRKMYKGDCCHCERCLGSHCPNKEPYEVVNCDECGREIDDTIYSRDGVEELCDECLLKKFIKEEL